MGYSDRARRGGDSRTPRRMPRAGVDSELTIAAAKGSRRGSEQRVSKHVVLRRSDHPPFLQQLARHAEQEPRASVSSTHVARHDGDRGVGRYRAVHTVAEYARHVLEGDSFVPELQVTDAAVAEDSEELDPQAGIRESLDEMPEIPSVRDRPRDRGHL